MCRCTLTVSSLWPYRQRVDGDTDAPSRRRDCHFDDTPFLFLLKHLLKVEGGCSKMTVSPTARRERVSATKGGRGRTASGCGSSQPTSQTASTAGAPPPQAPRPGVPHRCPRRLHTTAQLLARPSLAVTARLLAPSPRSPPPRAFLAGGSSGVAIHATKHGLFSMLPGSIKDPNSRANTCSMFGAAQR